MSNDNTEPTNKKPTVITVYLSKGGVAKSALTALLANYLAAQGYTTVIFDLDRQGGQSFIYGLLDEIGRPIQVMDRVLKRQVDAVSAVTWLDEIPLPKFETGTGRLGLVGGGSLTPLAVDDIKNNPIRFKIHNTLDVIRLAIRDLTGYADFVIIDIGPSDSVLSIGALAATDYLIMPTETGADSVEQIGPVLDEVTEVREVNASLQIVGIVQVKTRYFFGGLRPARSVQIGQETLRRAYGEFLLCDARGQVEIPFDEDWELARWDGAGLLTADYVKKKTKDHAYRFLKAVCAKMEITIHD